MSSLPKEDALTTSTAKISRFSTTRSNTNSLFALALHALSLCVFLVVVAALLLLSPAAVVIFLPVACMAASVCLLCATTARLLAPPSVVQPGRAREKREGTHERGQEQDCVDVDRAEAPGDFGDDDCASSVEEEHGEPEQGRSFSSSSFDDDEVCDSWGDDDEHGRFFFVDTSSYCRTFYDLLAFWRSMERRALT